MSKKYSFFQFMDVFLSAMNFECHDTIRKSISEICVNLTNRV